jgi:hypothetical protein
MVGIGIGSVLMNMIRILFLATVTQKDVSAITFFSIAATYLFFCSILSVFFVRKYNHSMKYLYKVGSNQLNMSEVHQSKLENQDSESLWNRSK